MRTLLAEELERVREWMTSITRIIEFEHDKVGHTRSEFRQVGEVDDPYGEATSVPESLWLSMAALESIRERLWRDYNRELLPGWEEDPSVRKHLDDEMWTRMLRDIRSYQTYLLQWFCCVGLRGYENTLHTYSNYWLLRTTRALEHRLNPSSYLPSPTLLESLERRLIPNPFQTLREAPDREPVF